MRNSEKVSISERIGYEVKLFRESRGMTQARLAQETGLSTGKISDIERGKVVCNVETLELLASECQDYLIYMLIIAIWGKEEGDRRLIKIMGEKEFKKFQYELGAQGPVLQNRTYDREEVHMKSEKKEDDKKKAPRK